MADPLTWAAIGTTVAGGAMGFVHNKAAGKAAQRAHEYNAGIQERNAKVAENQGEWTKLVTNIENLELKRDFRSEIIAAATTAYNKANVTISGTAKLVLEESARQLDEEVAMRTMGAEVEAGKYREQAINYRLDASLQRLYGRQARTAGKYRGYQALLSGATQAASIYASA